MSAECVYPQLHLLFPTYRPDPMLGPRNTLVVVFGCWDRHGIMCGGAFMPGLQLVSDRWCPSYLFDDCALAPLASTLYYPVSVLSLLHCMFLACLACSHAWCYYSSVPPLKCCSSMLCAPLVMCCTSACWLWIFVALRLYSVLYAYHCLDEHTCMYCRFTMFCPRCSFAIVRHCLDVL